VYELTSSDVELMSPRNGAAPLLKSSRDAAIMRQLYLEHPVLDDRSASQPLEYWSPDFVPIFHMSNDSAKFKRREELVAAGFEMDARRHFVTDSETYLPLYEGKYIYLLDHRYGSFETVPESQRYGRKAPAPNPTAHQLADPEYEIVPRYWFPLSVWEERRDKKGLRRDYQFHFRDVAGVYPDLRTAIGAVSPAGPAGDKAPALNLPATGVAEEDARRYLCFAGLFCSVPFDYIVRNKLFSKSLKWNTLGQIPMPAPTATVVGDVRQRALTERLVQLALAVNFATASLKPLGAALGIETPYVWQSDTRFDALREIDALAGHLYGLQRAAFEYVLSTFETLARSEQKAFGRQRTAETALEHFDRWTDSSAHVAAAGAIAAEEGS
jgi:hypothetical protein